MCLLLVQEFRNEYKHFEPDRREGLYDRIRLKHEFKEIQMFLRLWVQSHLWFIFVQVWSQKFTLQLLVLDLHCEGIRTRCPFDKFEVINFKPLSFIVSPKT